MHMPNNEVSKVTQDELAYHQQILRDKALVEAAAHHWMLYLGQKYGLSLTDVVEEDGTITRAEGA